MRTNRTVAVAFASLVMSTSCTALAADLWVDASAAPGGDGTQDRPFTAISEALAVVATGEEATIHVAAGTYTEGVGDGADEYGTATKYTFLGGYAPGFGERDPELHETIVNAVDPTRPVFWFYNARSVIVDGFTASGGSAGVVIDGWASGRTAIVRSCRLVENGTFTGDYSDPSLENGAGVRLEALTMELTDSVITDNHGANYGAGVYLGPTDEAATHAVMTGNVVARNTAHGTNAHGAGVWISVSGEVRGNVIDENVIDNPTGVGPGGGLIVYGTNTVVYVERNIVTNNRANSGGGGVFVDDRGDARLTSNIIAYNVAKNHGSGVDVDGMESDGSHATLVNNTIVFNGDVDRSGQGLYARGGSQITSTNDLYWGNGTGGDLHADSDGAHIAVRSSLFDGTSGSVDDLGSNLQGDPGFVGETFHVAPGSSVVDAGASDVELAADIACIPRPEFAGVDIGAFELAPSGTEPEAGCVSAVDVPAEGGGGSGEGGGSSGAGGDGGAGSASNGAGGGDESRGSSSSEVGGGDEDGASDDGAGGGGCSVGGSPADGPVGAMLVALLGAFGLRRRARSQRRER